MSRHLAIQAAAPGTRRESPRWPSGSASSARAGWNPAFGGRNSSVGTVLGSLSCVHPAWSPPVGEIFPLGLTWILTPFPRTFSGEIINRDPACAEIHVLDG